ncbi:MAG TPA: DUF938 domain-containing protein [Anaeromyxobacteraceae bacterium]|nr:DUF938 domain-containing protein [Anaeromyxobacteraceae bacterium]
MKRHAPAAARNREELLAALRPALPARGLVLELGSGTGEHAVFLARALPGLEWQPSDPDPLARESIADWSAEAALPNLRPPLDLDLRLLGWRRRSADALLVVNVLHVAPPEVSEALLEGAGEVLPEGGPLCVYGPFATVDEPLSPELARLDADLRRVDGSLGVRELEPFLAAARGRGLGLDQAVALGGERTLLVLRRLG